MLTAIDIGNTNIIVGLYKGKTLKDHFRISTRRNMTGDEAGFMITAWLERMKIANEDIDRVVIGSVVPPLTDSFEEMAKRHLGCLPVVVSSHIKLPISIRIDHPDQIGADRIANAAGGFALFGGPVIILDCGTATTFDVVDKNGAYIGGVILPGPETGMTELTRRAARLFDVRIERPDSVVGKTTAGALKSGLFYGAIGQIDYICEQILKETGFENPAIVATGGLSSGIAKDSRYVKSFEPSLTLEGLRIIAEMN